MTRKYYRISPEHCVGIYYKSGGHHHIVIWSPAGMYLKLPHDQASQDGLKIMLHKLWICAEHRCEETVQSLCLICLKYYDCWTCTHEACPKGDNQLNFVDNQVPRIVNNGKQEVVLMILQLEDTRICHPAYRSPHQLPQFSSLVLKLKILIPNSPLGENLWIISQTTI